MNFIMLDGTGDPNGNQGFQQAVEVLCGLSFTIKMSKMKNKQPEGYFDYAVPPLEGLWWIDGGGFSFEERDNWRWTLMIRQPEFVTREVFGWAAQGLAARKNERYYTRTPQILRGLEACSKCGRTAPTG